MGYFLCLSVASCHQISWNCFLLDLLAKIIVLGSFNLNYLSREKNYRVILMGVIPHLVMPRLCLSGKLRMLRLWPGSLAQLNLTLFSIWGLIKLLLPCGIISTRFTIKTTLLGIFNWSMRWLISHKEVFQLRNIFLFGLIISTLFMLMFPLQLSLLSKQCMQPASGINSWWSYDPTLKLHCLIWIIIILYHLWMLVRVNFCVRSSVS